MATGDGGRLSFGGLKAFGALLSAILLTISCKPMGPSPESQPRLMSAPVSAARPVEATRIAPIKGMVLFPVANANADRRLQATMAEVATAATVSLIDTGTNQTLSTALTNAQGQFVLTFSGGFIPQTEALYYLEALKGLGNNLPGRNVARVRTLLKWQGTTWGSLTQGSLVLNSATTALAIGSALKNGNPGPFAFSSLIGSVVAGSPSTYTPVSGLPQTDYDALLALVQDVLAADQDPVAGVGFSLPSSWLRVNSSISVWGTSVSSGSVGATVTISGLGFSATLGNNIVRFNGVLAGAPTAGSGSSLTVTVPPGATAGTLTVQVGNLIVLGPNFAVNVVVSGFNPAGGSAGTGVAIDGSGFDPVTVTNNTVTFAGAAATVTGATATTLSATVPSSAISGSIVVSVGSSTATSSTAFIVPVVVSSFAPASGGAGTAVTVSGSGFGSNVGAVTALFNGVAGTVTSVSPTSLTVTAPVSTTGPVAITTAGQTGTSVANFSYGVALHQAYETIANVGDRLMLEGQFGASVTVNFPGGIASVGTILGGGRVQVVVPAGVTAGTLSITSGGETKGAIPYRRPAYTLGLNSPAARIPQTDFGRASVGLITPRRYHGALRSGDYLYVIGGYTGVELASIERALVHGDGSLGPFAAAGNLVSARWGFSTVILGSFAYVVGGRTGAGNLASIERAPINADGSLGAFATLAGVSLPTPKGNAALAVAGNSLYVIGGFTTGDAIDSSTARAAINADGSIGSFSTIPGNSLLTARYFPTVNVVGNYLYVVGGYGPLGPRSDVERATINGDGSLGAFSIATGIDLVTPRGYHSTVVMGNNLYVLGGYNGLTLGSVERAAINPDFSLGAFAAVPDLAFKTARYGFKALVTGNHLTVVGGYNETTGTHPGIERASLNATANVNNTISTSLLASPRYAPAAAVVGNFIYVMGGGTGAGWINSVERAAINPDGTLGAFALVPAMNLVTARNWRTAAVIGNWLYVIGGESSLNEIERAPINADGSLGAFAITASPAFATARRYHNTAVAGNYLYLLNGAAPVSNSIERATINPDGSLGPMATYTTSVTIDGMVTPVVTSNYFYLIFGGDGGRIERATISSDGSLGPFAAVTGVSTVAGLDCSHQAATTVVGSYVYCMGGYNVAAPGAAVTGGQRALINADGTLGSFATLPGFAFGAPDIYGVGTVTVGDYLYVMGGYNLVTGAVSDTVRRVKLQ